MSVERNGKFITLSAGGDSLQIPFAAYESGKQTTATVVDQARTADGIVRGSVIAKANKIIGWQPQVIKEQGLDNMLNWLQNQ